MIEQKPEGLYVTAPMLIANARALLEAGRDFLRKRTAVSGSTEALVFDLSRVSETDSSSLSVIFAWLRSAQAQGVQMRIAHPPKSMMSLAELYGVSDALPLA